MMRAGRENDRAFLKKMHILAILNCLGACDWNLVW